MPQPSPLTPTCTKPRGFGSLPCPLCGESGTVSIDLSDLTADEACQCRACDGMFGIDDIRDFIQKWTSVLAWLETAPELKA